MRYLYIDFETYYDPKQKISLANLTLRSYFEAIKDRPERGMLGLGFTEDDAPIRFVACVLPELRERLREIAASDDWCVVAHNASFDIRVWRFVLGLPQPKHVDCTLELAQGAWPNQPTGYSLKALAEWFGLAPKLSIDLTPGSHGTDELATYCTRDVELCRELHKRELARLDPREVEIQRMCQALRELHLEIDQQAVATALDGFMSVSKDEARAVAGMLDLKFDEQNAFGVNEDGSIRSVKPHVLKDYLLDVCGYEAQSISVKKNNPARLAANDKAAGVIHAAARANKALSHTRRVAAFSGVQVVDVELCYHAAHTGRYSSKMSANSTGKSAKGLNCHNCPKRAKKISKLVRSIFACPSTHCWVSGDLANIEYRREGILASCEFTRRMFEENALADPYGLFGTRATGIQIVKGMPARRVFKNCVLGLGFLMGIQRWISELLLLLADAENGISLGDLDDLCRQQKWTPVSDGRAKAAQTKLGAPWQVASVAFHTMELFHEIHPEFRRLAVWLHGTLCEVSHALDPDRCLDRAYDLPSAPPRSLVNVVWDPDMGPGRCIRVGCDGWVPTVTWRDLGVHDTKFGPCFSSLLGNNKGYRSLTPSVCIENITQADARVKLVRGKLALRELGYSHILSVHDEIKLYVPRNHDMVMKARNDLLSVYGPGNSLGQSNSVMINPAEVTVTRTLYDPGEMGAEFWTALESGDDSVLTTLP